MKITVLIENTAPENLSEECVLSVFIEYNGKKILLDTGASDKFLTNAEKLGIDISSADCAVLSHAHYDHADGIDAFMSANKTAPLYLRSGSKENCFTKYLFLAKYVGIKKGTLEKYADRIAFADGDFKLYDGVYLIPHKTDGLEQIGKHSHMYVKNNGKYEVDNFSHEQSLVFDTENGLVIFNSCSHGGAYNIINEVAKTFPDKRVNAVIGGFHLYGSSGKYIDDFAGKLAVTSAEHIITGHCTGKKAYNILKTHLGDRLSLMKTGMVFEF